MKKFATTFLLLHAAFFALSQQCTTPGQTPATAFPVCGTTTFHQSTVPLCGNQSIPVPGCGSGYTNKNPFWYKFTCYQSGTLGLLIQPVNPNSDYDWQLFDITNRDPNEVFTNSSLVVTGNWAGTYGNTGASPAGVSFIQCGSSPADNMNTFSTMPNLIAGHTYLLLVSHFTDSQSGYSLSFGGGTAVITDPTQPAMVSAEAGCGGDLVRLKLNKKIKCNSIAANGSDFSITPAVAGMVSATGIGCTGGFDSDSLIIQLSNPLPPGNYTLNIQAGNDGNTLLDHCDNAIPAGSQISFTVHPMIPTPMDSLAPVSCSPNSLRLVFKKPMLCSSIASNGSDFLLSGPYPVSISGASGDCGNGTTNAITVVLSQPLQQAGTFTLTLKTGSDGNTLLDECGVQTPAASLMFTVKDTVNADFTYQKFYGCTVDTVNYYHPGGNGITNWQWTLGENNSSTLQNPQAYYTVFNNKQVTLVVSNGFCSDTSSSLVVLDNALKADFSVYDDNCPGETVSFTSLASGKIVSHDWNFGDGSFSTSASPAHIYAQPATTTPFNISYTVTDSLGCQKTKQKTILIYSSCYIAVPNAFTPNGDGRNDFLRVLNAVKAEDLEFLVYTRWGQLIFRTRDWKKGWDGRINGVDQPSGTYVWLLSYRDRDTKEARTLRGTATLIR